jgi:hypothetical protein
MLKRMYSLLGVVVYLYVHLILITISVRTLYQKVKMSTMGRFSSKSKSPEIPNIHIPIYEKR